MHCIGRMKMCLHVHFKIVENSRVLPDVPVDFLCQWNGDEVRVDAELDLVVVCCNAI